MLVFLPVAQFCRFDMARRPCRTLSHFSPDQVCDPSTVVKELVLLWEPDCGWPRLSKHSEAGRATFGSLDHTWYTFQMFHRTLEATGAGVELGDTPR